MYKESEKKINDIVKKYGGFCFRLGVSVLRNIGYDNINSETIAAEKEKYINKQKEIEVTGKNPIIPVDMFLDALDIAYLLCSFDAEDLAVYVQDNIHYDSGQKTLSKKRLEILLENVLTIIYENVDDPINFIELLKDECGFTDVELKYLGYETFLDYYDTINA